MVLSDIVANLSIVEQRHLGIIGTAVALASSYGLYRLLSSNKSLEEDNCPIVPYSNRLTGSNIEYQQDPQGFVEKYTALYGPVFRARVYGRLHTIVSGTFVRQILFNDSFNFGVGVDRRFDLKLFAGMGNEDMTSEDIRAVIVKSLTGEMKTYTPRAVQYINIALQEALGDLSEPKEIPNLFPMVQHMVAKASASVFVGTELAENKEIVEAFEYVVFDIARSARNNNAWLEYFTNLNRFRMWFIGKFMPPIRERKRRLREAIIPVINKRLAKMNAKDSAWKRPSDILQDMLENYPPPATYNSDIYTYYSHWMIGLIFAAVHTTSEHGTMILYRLLKHPEIINELIEEQKQVFKDNFNSCNGDYNDITTESLKKLVKLDSVCRETLRVKNDFLTLPHVNISNKHIVLSNGVVIPPGQDVLLNAWANQHDSYFQKDSKGNYFEFMPFRYVGIDRPSTKIGDDYLVFGEGKHACPGRWFAIQEIKTIISLILRNYTIKASSPVEFPTNAVTRIPSGKVLFEKRKF